ncbi:MAG: hypothetical protein JNM81_17590 [Rhodospirillaceae bacterium]|nr:hypothetical protein [Rhodospirillaceae bacterium]
MHLITGFTGTALKRFLDSHVCDDFIIREHPTDSNTSACKPVVLAFSSPKDRDHVQSLMRVRGHRLAPRRLRIEHYSAVA